LDSVAITEDNKSSSLFEKRETGRFYYNGVGIYHINKYDRTMLKKTTKRIVL
jgi:hypothetical protein